MLKFSAAVLLAALTSTAAFAQAQPDAETNASSQASAGVLRYEVRADLNKARASGAWPVRESSDFQAVAVAPVHKAAAHHPRKEYPNVMGMTIDQWLASREAAANPAGE